MSRVRRRGLIGVVMAAAGLLVLAPAASAIKKPRKPGPVLAVSATAAATGDGALAQAHAVCPPKTRAVGGGFSETPPFDILGGGFVGVVFDFEKLGQKAWRAKAQNLDPGPPNTVVLTVYVYCRRNAAKTGTASISNGTAVPNILPPPGVATCVNGKAGAGGYTTAPPVTDAGLLQNQVIGSFPNGAKAWQTTTATGNGAAATTSFGGFAYCARFPKRTAPRPSGHRGAGHLLA